MKPWMRWTACGLSPRVRGKRSRCAAAVYHSRSIPACAGEAHRIFRRSNRYRVYPRVCGGSAAGRSVGSAFRGLSPRVRGKRPRWRRRGCGRRSIPACAGEAVGGWPSGCRRAVYPRVCGGSRGRASRQMLNAGLSPRVRGKLGNHRWSLSSAGSIPACAGEAPFRCFGRIRRRVYPRVCGGSCCGGCCGGGGFGLSPRVRGKLRVGAGLLAGHRSIPACAGEAPVRPRWPAGPGVYPRVCGGSHCGRPARFVQEGLSPRVRGKPPDGGRGMAGRRSIPACAGEAPTAHFTKSVTKVYPRVCGGSRIYAEPVSLCRGLSPRVRGKPRRPRPRRPRRRSIPACAGEAARSAGVAHRP